MANHYEHKFLPGKSLEPEEDCDDYFENFRNCYMKNMLRSVKHTPAEGSMLHEYLEEQDDDDDNDAEDRAEAPPPDSSTRNNNNSNNK